MFAVTDIRLSEACRHSLQALGFSIVSLPPFPSLDPRIASHPDMLMLPLDDFVFIHETYYPIAKRQFDLLFSKGNLIPRRIITTVGFHYPNDVPLNILATKDSLVARADQMPQDILLYAKSSGREIIDTKQGYAKCSTLLLGDTAAITADPSIDRALHSRSIETLRISPGHISLDGYDYGFIGGASGVYEKTVFFCGNIETHPDAQRIVDFCNAHGYQVVCLSDGPLFDMGTIFFL